MSLTTSAEKLSEPEAQAVPAGISGNDNKVNAAVLEAQHDSHDKPTRTIKGARWAVVVLSILSSTFLYALDNTVTANVRPSMIETFGNRVEWLTWLSVSYPMGEVGMSPLWYVLEMF